MSRPRVPNADVILARARLFGFAIRDDDHDSVKLVRDGRESFIDLANSVRYGGSDARDIYLLSLATGDGHQWLTSTIYFRLRIGDDEVFPVQLRIGGEKRGRLYLDEFNFDELERRQHFQNLEELEALLPYLAPANYLGYHTARDHIIAGYLSIAPRSWEDAGVSLADAARLDACHVTPKIYAEARADGMMTVEEVIEGCYIPFPPEE